MTKAERRAALRNYALSGLVLGVATGAIRALGGSSTAPHTGRGGLLFFVLTVLLSSLVGLLVGVVVLRLKQRADAKRGGLGKQLTKQDDAPF